jgi:hypothetical protein
MRTLRGEDWIDEREVKTGGKYTLSTPIGEIVKSLEDKKLRESAEVMENIRLRNRAGAASRCGQPRDEHARGAAGEGIHHRDPVGPKGLVGHR